MMLQKLNVRLFLVVILFLSPEIKAQVTVEVEEPDELVVNFGNATTNALSKEKSGQFIGTFPGDKNIDDSWLVDMFVELGRKSYENRYEFGVLAELHRNTLVAKEQKLLQFGIVGSKDLVWKKKSDSTVFLSLNMSLNMKHSDDMVKNEKGLQGNVSFSLSLTDSLCKISRWFETKRRIFDHKNIDYLFNLKHNHSVGLGYLGGNSNAFIVGFSVLVDVFPLSGVFYDWFKQPELLFVSYSLNGRSALFGKTDLDLHAQHIRTAGIRYIIKEKKSEVGLSYAHQRGADPYTRFANQEFGALTINLKLAINSPLKSTAQ